MTTTSKVLTRGQHVAVVGGSSGMGLAVARQSAAAGARVTILGRDPGRLQAASREVDGSSIQPIDLKDPRSISAAAEALGDVDHLVVTAGTFSVAPLASSSEAEWRDIFEERLIGPFSLIKALDRRLSGSIVLFSGIRAKRPNGGSLAFTVAVAAVEAAIGALALELAPVRVNGVSPGMIDTPMLDGVLGSSKADVTKAYAANLPARRIGSSDDAASAAMMLLSNAFINGVVIEVDGGAVLL